MKCYRYVLKRDSCKNIENETVGMSTKVTLIVYIVIVTLFSGCHPENKAMDFLLSNRYLYDYAEKALVDSMGNIVSYSPYDYETLYNAEDTLELLTIFNAVYVKNLTDETLVTEDFIEAHVEEMLEKWRTSPYYDQLSWNEFLEYWLPYRADGEKFSDYYEVLSERYAPIRDSLQEGKSIVEVTNLLEKELRTWLKFDLRAHALLNKPSILETIKSRKGGCNTLTEFVCMALRTIGIVAAIDECPVWAHRNSGHQWNVVRAESGKWLPFNGGEDLIGEFKAINDSVKAPKIYRKQFSSNPSFAPVVPMEEILLLFLNDRRRDVTSQYVQTADVTVSPEIERTDSILYLAVFNDEQWKIVAWSTLQDGKATFLSMGCNDIVYLPVYYQQKILLPAGNPFILHADGTRTVLNVDPTQRTDRILENTNVMFDSKWMKAKAAIGRELKLYYWDNEWILCDTYVMREDKIIRFKNIPKNGLYLINGTGWDNTWQRIFTLDADGEQRWY